ncbi:aminotransferase class I/II-fold pyridoxal phosphate-dependent enzyme [Pikeienuella piscinae]|uniref:Aminotransferase class I/II-fold pyridoxal phosphate-dependent enzyme n=1 Tax=Pikeienuella piscinae TaxID=2748098 RepID=A0A7L5BYR3_9RHOB|nr:aminotransferase class I/II-fold pyridoxal phosphate-dependent enzyme [Pikeienuella piscinae]QIE56263.1 aminotransferase class I/II-fold pyridoxal phosphate-dependent enzyme [Pikeienuella piscinae]
MQAPERFSNLPEYAFPRLRALLDPYPPGPAGANTEPVAMSLGEPRHPPPPFLAEALARHLHLYGKYPPNEGHPDLLEACAAWTNRRYGVSVDAGANVFPLNGTREGLFNACLALSPESKNGGRAAVLLPNPFYQCYAVAALTAGAEPVYVNATAETGHLPDYATLDPTLLDRVTVAYICSPANPQGAVAGPDYWAGLLALAERHDFRIFADECYAEIYRDAPPPGILSAVRRVGADPERVLAFHSLSKRSNLPGLRSGFCVGGAGAVTALRRLRAYTGAPLPLPAQLAAAEIWRDETHVEANRALYAEKYALAERIIGFAPKAGFFLWIGVGDGEETALRLWREHGVKVLPGSYLSREASPGAGVGDPGWGYVRAALVDEVAHVERGLHAIREVIGG